ARMGLLSGGARTRDLAVGARGRRTGGSGYELGMGRSAAVACRSGHSCPRGAVVAGRAVGVIDHPRLERLLGGEDLAWLVGRVRKRMERGESLDTSVTLTDATVAQRAAIQRLLGRPPLPGRAVTVSLAAVRRLLRHSGACPDGLEAAIIALTGDVVDRRAA